MADRLANRRTRFLIESVGCTQKLPEALQIMEPAVEARS